MLRQEMNVNKFDHRELSRRGVICGGVSTAAVLFSPSSSAVHPVWGIVSLFLRSAFSVTVKAGVRNGVRVLLRRPFLSAASVVGAKRSHAAIRKTSAYRQNPHFAEKLISAVGAEMVLQAMSSAGNVWVAKDRTNEANRLDSSIIYKGEYDVLPAFVSPILVERGKPEIEIKELARQAINLKRHEKFTWADCIANVPFSGDFDIKLKVAARAKNQEASVVVSKPKPVSILPVELT